MTGNYALVVSARRSQGPMGTVRTSTWQFSSSWSWLCKCRRPCHLNWSRSNWRRRAFCILGQLQVFGRVQVVDKGGAPERPSPSLPLISLPCFALDEISTCRLHQAMQCASLCRRLLRELYPIGSLVSESSVHAECEDARKRGTSAWRESQKAHAFESCLLHIQSLDIPRV